MTSGYMLEVRFMIDFNYLQCVPRNTLTHNEKPKFVYLTKLPKHWPSQWQQSKNVWKYYGIWERRQQCTLCFQACFQEWVLGTHRFIGFWVRLGFAKWYEVVAFLQDWINCVSAMVCTRLQLCNKECKKMKQTWKKTTHITKNVSQIVKFFAQS
jgi:hypothetical protein